MYKHGRLEQHEIFADGNVGVVQQTEVSYSKKGLQETMSLVEQAFMKVLKEPT